MVQGFLLVFIQGSLESGVLCLRQAPILSAVKSPFGKTVDC